MSKEYIEDQTIEKADYSNQRMANKEYDHCNFINCNFSAANLFQTVFIDCQFTGCNLKLTQVPQTGFQQTLFTDCNLTGIHWHESSPFLYSPQFNNCILTLGSFYAMKLKQLHFINCQLHEVIFTEADLTETIFSHCDLDRAVFDNTLLHKTDFTTAFNFSIHPPHNKLSKTRFTLQGLPGLLNQYDIIIE
jgi:fluoroquinolone resistance protein